MGGRVWAPPSGTGRTSAVVAALDEVEGRLQPLDRAIALSEWRLFAGKPGGGAIGVQLARSRLLAHPDLRAWCLEAQRGTRSTEARRRLELLGRMAILAQLEQHPRIVRQRASLERKIEGFRPRWRGRRFTPTELEELVDPDPDRGVRREGHYVPDRFFRSIEPAVRSLVRARNHRARELGFRSYPEARLSMEGLSVRRLEALMGPFRGRARAAARALRDRFQDQTGESGWYPWDMSHQHRKELWSIRNGFSRADCLPAVRKGVRAWGFGSSDLDFRLTRRDTPFAGLEIAVEAPQDVRVIANPRAGWIHYAVLFHEVGHAVHSRSVRGRSHLLRHHFSGSFAGFEEGIGGLFESIPSELAWLATRRGVTHSMAIEIRRRSWEGLLLTMASLIGRIRAELALYRDPETDPAPEYARYLRREFAYDDFEPTSWAHLMLVNPALYQQSYLLATIFGPQVLDAALRDVGGTVWPNRRLGPWLKEHWLRPGARDDWIPKVERVTGRPLGAETFLAQAAAETQ